MQSESSYTKDKCGMARKSRKIHWKSNETTCVLDLRNQWCRIYSERKFRGGMMVKLQLIKEATFVCCPMCDKEKCVGRYQCEEIKRYAEERKKDSKEVE